MKIFSVNKSFDYQNVRKNVRIEDYKMPAGAVNELYGAADTINNYMGAKKAKVRFFNPSEMFGKNRLGQTDDFFSKCVGIGVKTKKAKNENVVLVNYFTKPETPFLRKVYDSLQYLVEGKNSPIEAHKKNTVANLIKSGKIKI